MNTLAKTRERRSNAGSRMGQMLDKEEEDFYKSTYGGFFEEEDDQEYVSEDSESDNVDSDFDIDERDEVVEQEEETEKKRKRAKPFRETPRRMVVEKKPTKPAQPRERPPPPSSRKSDVVGSPIKSKNLRTSTQIKSEDTRKRKRLAERNRKTVPKKSYREMSQEELLAEARETEKLNVKSLERYQKLELEKSRKSKVSKERITGPFVRLQSLTMPLIDEEQPHNENEPQSDVGKCSRNFITFSEEQLFLQNFPHLEKSIKSAGIQSRSTTCPVTKLPARFFDPVTNLPYANSFAFKTLRNAYLKQLALIDPSCQTEDIRRFLDWQRKNSGKLKDKSENFAANPNGVSDNMSTNNETSPNENL